MVALGFEGSAAVKGTTDAIEPHLKTDDESELCGDRKPVLRRVCVLIFRPRRVSVVHVPAQEWIHSLYSITHLTFSAEQQLVKLSKTSSHVRKNERKISSN